MRFRLLEPYTKDQSVAALLHLTLDNEKLIELGEILFTLEEWTDFVREASVNGTGMSFDIVMNEAVMI